MLYELVIAATIVIAVILYQVVHIQTNPTVFWVTIYLLLCWRLVFSWYMKEYTKNPGEEGRWSWLLSVSFEFILLPAIWLAIIVLIKG